MYTGWIVAVESDKAELTELGVTLGKRDPKAMTWSDCEVPDDVLEKMEAHWGRWIWGLSWTQDESQHEELECCVPDTDFDVPGSNYPCTVNDYLNLLSCYWADAYHETKDIPNDDVFARWESYARPIIERLLAAPDEKAEPIYLNPELAAPDTEGKYLTGDELREIAEKSRALWGEQEPNPKGESA